MRRASRKRLTALLLLVSFLAANTLGALLHDHPADHHGDHACCHEHSAGEPDQDNTHHDDTAHNDADHDNLASGVRSQHDASLYDDDCLACRFAGQRSLDVDIASAEQFCQLSLKLSATPSDAPVTGRVLAARPRAPPLPC
jgi:hypothetical protein